jgi:protein-disulfide isomerase
MGLLGLIVGYTVGTGSVGVAVPAQVAQQPTVPSPVAAPEPQPARDVAPVDASTDHVRGNPRATISLIEYSDFECPFCSRHHPTMQQVLDAYGDDVNWVYRHFPLSFHPNAQKAAEASECASELGGNEKFWEMADMIFDKGSDNSQLVAYAKSIGLNETQFTTCLESGKYQKHIQDQMSEGSSAGVNGTPGTIILHNQTKESRIVSGAQPFTSFKTILDEMLGS